MDTRFFLEDVKVGGMLSKEKKEHTAFPFFFSLLAFLPFFFFLLSFL